MIKASSGCTCHSCRRLISSVASTAFGGANRWKSSGSSPLPRPRAAASEAAEQGGRAGLVAHRVDLAADLLQLEHGPPVRALGTPDLLPELVDPALVCNQLLLVLPQQLEALQRALDGGATDLRTPHVQSLHSLAVLRKRRRTPAVKPVMLLFEAGLDQGVLLDDGLDVLRGNLYTLEVRLDAVERAAVETAQLLVEGTPVLQSPLVTKLRFGNPPLQDVDFQGRAVHGIQEFWDLPRELRLHSGQVQVILTAARRMAQLHLALPLRQGGLALAVRRNGAAAHCARAPGAGHITGCLCLRFCLCRRLCLCVCDLCLGL